MPRYRFADFVLSPRRRTLTRDGREQPLIPRYFDLLVFLVERRGQAVHRRDIFDRVWNEVIVSDSALSQAIRTIRRALDDDSREPRFVRTVARHGYRFVYEDVIEEPDEGDALDPPAAVAADAQAMEIPEPLPMWMRGALGGGAAGLAGGVMGGLLLASAPDSHASFAVVPVLTVLGMCCGAAGGAGVGAGLSIAEGRTRTAWLVATVVGAAIGGGVVGLAVELLARWSLATLVGVDLPIGGSLEGLTLGAAAGFGYAAVADDGTQHPARVAVALAIACGLAALGLALAGRVLVGGTLHAIASASAGAQTTLTPLGHLFGEPDFGRLTAALIGAGEGVTFGAGLGLGLAWRR